MYDSSVEEKWRKYWKEHGIGLFDEKDRSRELYVLDTPPPYTSGTLHMGHVTSYSLIDFTARYKRMRGFNVLYPQGWDTQGFPTEKAVEKKYGVTLPREEFYAKCVELAEANLSTMKSQMGRLGFSPDERMEYITMSDAYKAKVQLSLILMLEKGFVYRGNHPVEWCIRCRSAIAHAETEEKEEETDLVYVRFGITGAKSGMVIATTRPELLHACVAVAVNPKDDRFKGLEGKHAKTPIFGRSVPIIYDESVDPTFGTGAEMVCTFGDKIDRDMYYRHSLKHIEAMDESGRLRNAGDLTGMKLKEAREAVKGLLAEAKAIEKTDRLKHMVKVHDRCDTPINLLMSMQWAIRIKEHAEKIKELSNEMRWEPQFMKRYLEDWANFIDWDWIISRNRVFGTPIPFWYCTKCDFIAAPDKRKLPVDPSRDKPPVRKCPKCGGGIAGETATCDVWVDSSITPLVIAGWPDDKELFKRAYPASLRIQGSEIIRTWAFYTIFRSWALAGNKPFEDILVHGMILAPDGKRMHKSKGNGISPEEILAKYPADTIRLWAALSGAIGKDKPFLYNDIDYAKSFITKLFNSSIFVESATKESGIGREGAEGLGEHMNAFDLWILARMNSVARKAVESYDAFNFYEAMNSTINFYWHEFCDYYIEDVKHRIYSKDPKLENSKKAAVHVLNHVLYTTVKILAPVMPHAAEEVYSKAHGSSIFLERFPVPMGQHIGVGYDIYGVLFKGPKAEIDYCSIGAVLNAVITEVRKAKAREKKALNAEIASINIKVPEEYYNTTLSSKDEIALICKAGKVSVQKGEFSVETKI